MFPFLFSYSIQVNYNLIQLNIGLESDFNKIGLGGWAVTQEKKLQKGGVTTSCKTANQH